MNIAQVFHKLLLGEHDAETWARGPQGLKPAYFLSLNRHD
jgi:hypothetical protein